MLTKKKPSMTNTDVSDIGIVMTEFKGVESCVSSEH